MAKKRRKALFIKANQRKINAGYSRELILPENLYGIYIHNTINPFVNTLKSEGANILESLEKKFLAKSIYSIDVLDKRIAELKLMENAFVKNFFPNKNNAEAIKEFSQQLSNDSILSNFFGFINNFGKVISKKTPKYKNAVTDELLNEFFSEYKKQINKGIDIVNKIAKQDLNFLNSKKINENFYLERQKLLASLPDEWKKVSEILIDLTKTNDEKHKELTAFFKRLITITKTSSGIILEPLIQETILKLNKFLDMELIGFAKTSSELVADNRLAIIEICNAEDKIIKTSVGINIKSALAKYKIKRETSKAFKNVEFNDKELYFRKNLIVLNSNFIDWDPSSGDLSVIKNYYNDLYRIEEKFNIIYHLLQIFDMIEEDIEIASKKGWTHSIFIYYQGGLIWTSSILSAIRDFIKIGSGIEIDFNNKIINPKLYINKPADKQEINQLYNKKRKMLRQKKKERITDDDQIYKSLSTIDSMSSISEKVQQESLIKTVWYEINLENFKNTMGGR